MAAKQDVPLLLSDPRRSIHTDTRHSSERMCFRAVSVGQCSKEPRVFIEEPDNEVKLEAKCTW